MRVFHLIGRLAAFAVVAVLLVAVSWFLFVEIPGSGAELAGVVLVVLVALVALRVADSIAGTLLPSYNVAEVAVEGPIIRDAGGGPLSRGPVGTAADAIVEQIEAADADRGAQALLLRLNTPGGEIVPSEDITLAAERFDGPTVAYATDTCASGGYEIASGCDEIWAREGSIVGSIGVLGSRVTAAGLAEKLGVEYEGLTAGEYKDAGVPLKELRDHEREYLQGIVDDYYDQFVENVATRRDLDAEAIRDTEARVYLGSRAAEIGLVDELGTREDVEDRLEEQLGEEVVVEPFEPDTGIAGRLRSSAAAAAYAFGAGIAGAVTDADGGFELR